MTGTVLLYESRRRAFLSKGLFGLKFFLNCFWQPMLSNLEGKKRSSISTAYTIQISASSHGSASKPRNRPLLY